MTSTTQDQRRGSARATRRMRVSLPNLRVPFLEPTSGAGPSVTLVQILSIVVLAAIMGFLRNPDPLFNPALYGEDATWVARVLAGDLQGSYLNARPDYLVVGQIALLHMAVALNTIFFGLDVANLPRMIAVVSYVFVGGVAALGYAAFRRWLPSGPCAALVVGIVLLPLGNTSNEVLGRILNLGYLFYPISAFLIVLRPQLASGFGRTLVDIALLVCVATNPLCIVLVAAYLAMSAWTRISRGRIPFREGVLMSGIMALCLFYLPRFANAPEHERGVPTAAHLIEAFGARSLLYPIVFPFYQSLTDPITIALVAAFAGFVGWTIHRSDPGQRSLGLFLGVTTLLVVLLTLALRPGLTGQLRGYIPTVQDSYYQAQNVMALATLVWAVGMWSASVRGGALTVCALIYLFGSTLIFEFHSPRMAISVNGTFAESISRVWAENDPNGFERFVRIPTYPEGWRMMLPLERVRATVDDH